MTDLVSLPAEGDPHARPGEHDSDASTAVSPPSSTKEPTMPRDPHPDRDLLCPATGCPDRFPVSDEDPDATLAEVVVHLTGRHGRSLADAMNLLAQVREVPAGAGR